MHTGWLRLRLNFPPLDLFLSKSEMGKFGGTQNRLEKEMAALAERHRKIVSIRTFGHTVMGLPIKVLFAGNIDRCIACLGVVHAGESGPELLVPAVARLLDEQPELLKVCGVAIMPSVNCDGRERSARGYPCYLRTNSRGVDINRNFDADWDTVCYEYGLVSTNPDSMTYRGPTPESEPETKAVVSFLEATRPKAVFSFHALASLCDANFYTVNSTSVDVSFSG